jgi:ribonucleoside-diphosphate reductase beta chain
MSYHDKRLINGKSDINNLMPAKYPWAWDMVNKSIANTWFHHETPMGREKFDYEFRLSPDEREMFLNVFATLTTSDIAILRNLGASLMQHITAPEVELYLASQIAEERVHSLTYQHVIEVLALDQDDIYSRYLHVPEINDKFTFAGEYSNMVYEKRNLEQFLKGLIFYYGVFEGLWFYNGFSPIFSLQRRNMMMGTGTQLQYIMRDEAQHVAFGIKLIRGIEKEENFKLPEPQVHFIFQRAIELESAYAKRTMPPVLGYNADLHIEQAKFLANRRLSQLGYRPLFEATNVLPWLDEQINIKKEKNFFETRTTEYQSAASLDGTW